MVESLLRSANGSLWPGSIQAWTAESGVLEEGTAPGKRFGIVEREPGGGAEGGFLIRRDAVEEESHFPAETGGGRGGVTVHDDGLEVEQLVPAGRREMNAKGKGRAGFAGAVAAKDCTVRAELLQLEMR
jgi:hypothetical protein